MDEDEPITRKQREPITMVFTAVLLVAILIAVGIHINDNILHKTAPTVDEKSTVVVDYTGSFYNYYDQAGGAMFQTSVSSIEDNPDYVHAASYSSGSQLTVDMSGSDVLKKFQDALLGHKVGDKVRVAIAAEDAYNVPDFKGVYKTTVPASIISPTQKVEVFDGLGWTYTSDLLPTGQYAVALNMKADAVCTSTNTDFGTVKTTGFTYADGKMSFTLTVQGAKAVNDIYGNPEIIKFGGKEFKAIEMFALPHLSDSDDFSVCHVIGVDNVENPTEYLVKSSDERYNMDLYFEITVVSITDNS